MTAALVQFLLAAAIIAAAGIWLARFADGIAESTGLGRLLTGSLFLAAATSLPEMTVDLNAVGMHLPDIAVGDLLGSSLFNLLILMAVSAFFHVSETPPPHPQRQALAATLSIVLTAVIGAGIVANLDAGFLRAGLFSWLTFLFYLGGLWILFQQPPETGIAQHGTKQRLAASITGYLGCTVAIVLTAPYLAEAADGLARMSGLGHSFIGTTLVALSTSLPELAATIAAFRMNRPELAIGNIFGSNMFNMAMFLPLDWYYPGNLLHAAADVNAVTALGVIFCTAVAVAALLGGPRTSRRAVLTGNALVACSSVAVLLLIYRLHM